MKKVCLVTPFCDILPIMTGYCDVDGEYFLPKIVTFYLSVCGRKRGAGGHFQLNSNQFYCCRVKKELKVTRVHWVYR